MSVIPLTVDGEDASVVERKDYFDQEGKRILIIPLDRVQLEKHELEKSGDSNVSYDLRVGSEYRNFREKRKKPLKVGMSVILPAGGALIIQTQEFIHLPRTMFGIIAPKVTLLENGISNTFSKIDPGYEGHLLVSVFNLGKEPVPLSYGRHFCSLTLLQVTGKAMLYNKGPKQIPEGSDLSPVRKVSEWLEARTGYVHLIYIAAVVFYSLAKVAEIFFMKK